MTNIAVRAADALESARAAAIDMASRAGHSDFVGRAGVEFEALRNGTSRRYWRMRVLASLSNGLDRADRVFHRADVALYDSWVRAGRDWERHVVATYPADTWHKPFFFSANGPKCSTERVASE